MFGEGEPSIALNPLQIQKRNEVALKVKSGEYPFESVNCLNCGLENAESIAERDRYGLKFLVKLCRTCGLAYTSPRMTSVAYNHFYDEEYRPLYVGQERAGQAFYSEQKRQGNRIFNYLKNSGFEVDKPMVILEVGCGAGGILDAFRQKGHSVCGLDLGTEYVNYGKNQHGLDLRVGFLGDLPADIKPNLIIYSHVMEHILDPLTEMQEIYRRCGKDTLVYIEVPGLRNIHKAYQMDVMKYYQNAHSVHFTLNSLSKMMAKTGFKLLSGDEYVHAVFRIGESLDMLENEYKEVRDYLVKTEKKRWIYPFTLVSLKAKTKQLLKSFITKP